MMRWRFVAMVGLAAAISTACVVKDGDDDDDDNNTSSSSSSSSSSGGGGQGAGSSQGGGTTSSGTGGGVSGVTCGAVCSAPNLTDSVEGACVVDELQEAGFDTDTIACNVLAAAWAQGLATVEQCYDCRDSIGGLTEQACDAAAATCY